MRLNIFFCKMAQRINHQMMCTFQTDLPPWLTVTYFSIYPTNKTINQPCHYQAQHQYFILYSHVVLRIDANKCETSMTDPSHWYWHCSVCDWWTFIKETQTFIKKHINVHTFWDWPWKHVYRPFLMSQNFKNLFKK